MHINRHEGRHAVARVIFHGNRGELRQPYRQGQEDQLAALGFALNVLVLWNTQYMDDAVNHLRAGGREINDEHLARLSPLQVDHVLMLGTFPFTLPQELAGRPAPRSARRLTRFDEEHRNEKSRQGPRQIRKVRRPATRRSGWPLRSPA